MFVADIAASLYCEIKFLGGIGVTKRYFAVTWSKNTVIRHEA